MTTLDRRHLTAFVAVADALHFGRAAAALHMSQPALSRLIRTLEQDIGAPLLTRTTRRVTLTETGRIFYDHARVALAALDEAGAAARRAADGHLGRIRVGFTGPSTYEILPRVARAFRDAHPDAQLTLTGPLFSEEQRDLLLSDSLDIALGHEAVDHPELASRVVMREELVIALPDNHRLAGLATVPLAELARDPFVSYPAQRGSTIRRVGISACAAAGFVPNIVQEVGPSHALVALVAAGVGVALVSSSMRELWPAGVLYRPIDGPRYEVPLGFAWRIKDASPVQARFLEVVDSLFPPLP